MNRRAFLLGFLALAVVSVLWWQKSGQRLFLRKESTTGSPNEGVRIDLAEMAMFRVVFANYFKRFNVLPSGDSKAIAAELLGTGVNQRPLLEWDPGRLSSDGEFQDPWGTPYSFTFENTRVKMRSAGPDRRFRTADDGVSE